MTNIQRVILVLAALTFWAGAVYGESTKLRYAQSVYADDKGGPISSPEAVACNGRTLVIGDTANNRLVRFALEEGAVKGGNEIRLTQLSNPVRIRIGSKGDIYALDGKQRRIVRMSSDGAFKGNISPEGLPEGQSSVVPKSFALGSDDGLFVLDILSERVLVLNADGKYQRSIPFPKDFGFFSDIAVDNKGGVLLLDSMKARIYSAAKGAAAFSPLGNSFKEYLSFPVGLTTDPRGMIFVVDGNGATIGIVGQDGSFLGKLLAMGWTEGLLYYPTQACVNDKGRLFVADRGNSRVQEFAVIR